MPFEKESGKNQVGEFICFLLSDLTAKSSKSITFERKYKTPLLAVTHNYLYAGRFTVVTYNSKPTNIIFIMAFSNTHQNGVINYPNC